MLNIFFSLFPLFTFSLVHFHHNHHGHAFSKCNGIADMLGVSKITSNPEKARAGKDLTFTIKGKVLRDLTNPICRVHVRDVHKSLLPCEADGVTCPMTLGSDWTTSSTVHIPGKAEALAGQKIKIQVQCQDSESGNTIWDDSAPRISCIETSIKVSFWLENSSEQESEESEDSSELEEGIKSDSKKSSTLHSSKADIIENPYILAPVLGGISFGFLLVSVIVYWRIKRRPRIDVDDIWSATLVQTDTL